LPHFDDQKIGVCGFGNLYAATAFLHGAAIEEVSKSKLELPPRGADYFIVICARALA
jgi:hypothetical protein